MESSCEFGDEPSDSVKVWETTLLLHNDGLSNSAQTYKVSLKCDFCIHLFSKDTR
jgi:hypothetical protein